MSRPKRAGESDQLQCGRGTQAGLGGKLGAGAPKSMQPKRRATKGRVPETLWLWTLCGVTLRLFSASAKDPTSSCTRLCQPFRMARYSYAAYYDQPAGQGPWLWLGELAGPGCKGLCSSITLSDARIWLPNFSLSICTGALEQRFALLPQSETSQVPVEERGGGEDLLLHAGAAQEIRIAVQEPSARANKGPLAG